MARAIWSGVLSFGLVSVPVELYTATEAHGPVFHQFEKGTADRIRYQRVNERTGDEVEYSDIVKGADIGGGNYVLLDQDDKRRRPDRGAAVERGGGQEEIGREGTRQEVGPEDNGAEEDSTKRIRPESGGLRERLRTGDGRLCSPGLDNQAALGAGRWAAMEAAGSPDPRNESEAERDDRNLAELLQELRVAGLGVQVLFGFLLSLPFTNRFTRLSHGQRDLYLATLVLSALATALLLGPVAYHRLVFRRGMKEGLVRTASVMAIGGLAVVGLAVSAAVLLVTGFVASVVPAVLITVFVAGVFGIVWFAFPLTRRR
jgi:hypothetical protein